MTPKPHPALESREIVPREESEFVTRSGQCAGCAFAPGSPANQSLSMTKARLCVLSGEPFWCHWNVIGANNELLPGTRPTLCRGWVDATEARLEKGVQPTEFQRAIYLALNEAITEVELRPDLDEAQKIDLVNQRMLEFARREADLVANALGEKE